MPCPPQPTRPEHDDAVRGGTKVSTCPTSCPLACPSRGSPANCSCQARCSHQIPRHGAYEPGQGKTLLGRGRQTAPGRRGRRSSGRAFGKPRRGGRGPRAYLEQNGRGISLATSTRALQCARTHTHTFTFQVFAERRVKYDGGIARTHTHTLIGNRVK